MPEWGLGFRGRFCVRWFALVGRSVGRCGGIFLLPLRFYTRRRHAKNRIHLPVGAVHSVAECVEGIEREFV